MRPLVIYDFATAPFWTSLYMRKFWFSFSSVYCTSHSTDTKAFLVRADWHSSDEEAFRLSSCRHKGSEVYLSANMLKLVGLEGVGSFYTSHSTNTKAFVVRADWHSSDKEAFRFSLSLCTRIGREAYLSANLLKRKRCAKPSRQTDRQSQQPQFGIRPITGWHFLRVPPHPPPHPPHVSETHQTETNWFFRHFSPVLKSPWNVNNNHGGDPAHAQICTF